MCLNVACAVASGLAMVHISRLCIDLHKDASTAISFQKEAQKKDLSKYRTLVLSPCRKMVVLDRPAKGQNMPKTRSAWGSNPESPDD